MENIEPNHAGDQLVFLKLGGSLITDKHTARSPRREVINRIAREIASSLHQNPRLQWTYFWKKIQNFERRTYSGGMAGVC